MLLDIHTHQLAKAKDGQAIFSCTKSDYTHLSPHTYISLALHPWSLTADNMVEQLEWIEATCHSPQTLAIGEVGLDKLKGADFCLQEEAFRAVIQCASSANLPLILHNVRSTQEILQIRKEISPSNRWVMHGFRGKKEMARELIRHDISLSFGANFDKAALQEVPDEMLFVESDDENIDIHELCMRMALVRQQSFTDFSQQLALNVEKLFF